MHTYITIPGAILMTFLCQSMPSAGQIPPIIDGSSNTILVGEYTQGMINFGPLSFGLVELPTLVKTEFILGPITVNPQTPEILHYGLDDVLSVGVTFGDASWTALTSFDLEVENGVVESLTYAFSPVYSNTHTGGVVLNFPFSITGNDTASGEAFSYTYSDSTETISNVPIPATAWLFVSAVLGLGVSKRKRA